MATATTVVTRSFGHLSDNSGFVPTNAGALTTTEEKFLETTTTTSSEKYHNRRATIAAAAVSPASSVSTTAATSSSTTTNSPSQQTRCTTRSSSKDEKCEVKPISPCTRSTSKDENCEVKPISPCARSSSKDENCEVKPISPCARSSSKDENCEVKPISPCTRSTSKDESCEVKPISPCARSSSKDENCEVKPISLHDFEREAATVNPMIRRISVELIQKLSSDDSEGSDETPDSESTDETPAKPVGLAPNTDGKSSAQGKSNDDETNVGDEQDWTKKVPDVTDSSGNLIDDLDCDDESSASSMTTIIGSEHSSTGNMEDDLEDTFRLEDEEEKQENDNDENDDESDDRGNAVDALHSSCFVVFGDVDGDDVDTDTKSSSSGNTEPLIRPKTSRINPMTGRRSFTDDMQEWRENVLSSWTLKEPKKKAKTTARKPKKKITPRAKPEHTYLLRKTRTKSAPENANIIENINKVLDEFSNSASNSLLHTKCRELQNIAPYNLPGIEELYGKDAIRSNDATETATNDRESVRDRPSATAIKTEPDDREREIQIPPNSKECIIKIKIGDAIFVPRDGQEDDLKVPGRIIKESDESSSMNSSRQASSPERKKKRKTNRGLQNNAAGKTKKKRKINRWLPATGATSCPASTKNPKSYHRSGLTTKEKQKNIEPNAKQKSKASRKRSESPLNSEGEIPEISNGPTRIAKDFWFNPTRRKGHEKLKTFFGTIVGKRSEEGADLWHVVYDDGDEEDFDKTDLKEALDLYKSTKRLDKKHRVKKEFFDGESRKKPKVIHAAKEAKEQGFYRESHEQSTKQRPSLMPHFPRPCDKKKEMKFFSSSRIRKQSDLYNSRGRQSRFVHHKTEQVNDEDSVNVVDVVDLTEENAKIPTKTNRKGRKVIDFVDLTINF